MRALQLLFFVAAGPCLVFAQTNCKAPLESEEMFDDYCDVAYPLKPAWEVANLNDTCCPIRIGPIRLLETGNSIVDPQDPGVLARFNNASCASGRSTMGCFKPPAFYHQYSNVQSGTASNASGIAILSDSARNETFAQVREQISFLLKWSSRVMPNLADYLSKAYIRVLINSCQHFNETSKSNDWSGHPEGSPFMTVGAAWRENPSVGVEESAIYTGAPDCLARPQPSSAITQFSRTIHQIAIRELDPDAYIAIVCLSVRDTASGLYLWYNLGEKGEHGVKSNYTAGNRPAGQDQQRIESALSENDGEWAGVLAYDYFNNAIAVWLGAPKGDFLYHNAAGQRTTSRALLKRNSPDVACLLARYFPDVGEENGTYCPKVLNDTEHCRLVPGSCYCNASMTAEYLGPPVNRTKCPTLQQIKEQSGYKDKTLPGDAKILSCRGCYTTGCETDRGQKRSMAANPSGNRSLYLSGPLGNLGNSAAIHQSAPSSLVSYIVIAALLSILF